MNKASQTVYKITRPDLTTYKGFQYVVVEEAAAWVKSYKSVWPIPPKEIMQ